MSAKRKRAATKPEAQWDALKSEICDVYTRSDLPTLIKHMKDEHNFVASKNQYERKLKEWDLRKNATSQKWEYIVSRKHKRQKLGKETRITLHGKVIPEAKVKKQESRYTISELNRISAAALDIPSPPAPEGVSVFTPRPISPYLDALSPRASKNNLVAATKSSANTNIGTLPCFAARDFFTSHAVQLRLFGDRINIIRPGRDSSALPTIRNSDLGDGSGTIGSVHSSYSGPNHNTSSMTPASNDFIMSFSDEHENSTSITKASLKQHIIRSLEIIIPEKHPGDLDARIDRLFGPSTSDALLEFASLMVELTSNNAGSVDQNVNAFFRPERFLRWLTSQSDAVLQLMFSLKLPAVQACLDSLVETASNQLDQRAFDVLFGADKNQELYRGRRADLLLAAVKVGSVEAVRKLITKVGDLNSKTEMRYGRRYTILGLARQVEVTQLLLNAGADIEAPTDSIFFYHRNFYWTPCHHAAISGNTPLLRFLLEVGADFDPNIEFAIPSTSCKHPTDWGAKKDCCCHNFLDTAIDKQDVERIEILLGEGAETTTRHFLRAIRKGSTEILGFILATECGRTCLQTASHEDRWRPLIYAAKFGSVDMVRLLLDAGADVNWSDENPPRSEEVDHNYKLVSEYASTALLAAVQGGHMDVVLVLLEHQVDMNAPAYDYFGAVNLLEVAQERGHHDLASLLLQASAKNLAPSHLRSNKYLIHRMIGAAKELDTQTVERLVRNGIDPCHVLDWRGFLYLDDVVFGDERLPKEDLDEILNEILPAARNIISIFQVVCGNKINGTGPLNGFTALHIAVFIATFSGQLNTAEELIAGGFSNVNASAMNCGTPLQLAVHLTLPRYNVSRGERMTVRIVQMLLRNGADVNAHGESEYALRSAVISGDSDLVQVLLRAGGKVDMAGPHGTPLHWVFYEDSELCLETVRLLLEYGAPVDARSHQPTCSCCPRTGTPLQEACSNPFSWLDSRAELLDIVRLLLEYGADVNAPALAPYERTPLQGAALSGNLEMIKLLLSEGADINAPPAPKGATALQDASSRGYLKIVHMLLERGADPNAPGAIDGGMTALERAAWWGRLDTVCLLLDNGAKPSEVAITRAEEAKHFVIADIIRARIHERKRGEGMENQDCERSKEAESSEKISDRLGDSTVGYDLEDLNEAVLIV